MPVGLDGHPDPLVTPARTAVLERVAAAVCGVGSERVLVGIDGRSGAGKSTFGDELARVLERSGHAVVRSTTDLFHRPRAERLRLGPASPDGYYEHSHQLEVMTDELLAPFARGEAEVLVGAFDEPSDQPRLLRATVPARAVLVVDGLFLHRPELRAHWDVSVMLLADRRCDAAWLDFLERSLPDDPTLRAAELDRRLDRARWPRYRHGWRRYAESPGAALATFHVDNDDLAAPVIVDGGARPPDRHPGSVQLHHWPADFLPKKAGHECPQCMAGRVDETEHGVRFFAGEVADGYLQREAPTPGYSVVVFRGRHASALHELTPDEHAAFWAEVGEVARAIEDVFGPIHLNFQVLGNRDPHVHVHVVPRHDPDPAPSMPLPAEAWARAHHLTAEEMDDQLDRLRRALAESGRLRRGG